MKVALAFWGITRSLKYTIESIKTMILDSLKEANIDYDIYMHTYSMSSYKNIRTREIANAIDNDEYKLLNPTHIVIEDQDAVKARLNLLQYRTHRDPWNSQYNSVDNFLLAMYSKSELTKMIKTEYDYIIFLRPDVRYIDKFDPNWCTLATDNSIVIPNFHTNHTPLIKINDRFAITTMKTYKMYGDIFDQLLPISRVRTLHSEEIIGKNLYDNKCKTIVAPFRFQRVRVDGSTERRDIVIKLGS